MAITVIKQPGFYFENNETWFAAAYRDNILKVSTNSTATFIQYELQISEVTQLTQYAPVVAGVAVFNLKNAYSSILRNHIEIMGELDEFVEVATTKHIQTITEKLTEVIKEGAIKTIGRRILKASSFTEGIEEDWFDALATGFRHCFAGQYVPLSAIRLDDGAIGIDVNDVEIGEICTDDNNLGFGVWQQEGDDDVQKIEYTLDVDPEFRGKRLAEGHTLLIDRKCYPRKKTLYYLNQFGGWDWCNFVDYEKVLITEKEYYEKYTDIESSRTMGVNVTDKHEEMKLFSLERIAEYNNIQELIESPIVYDETGTRVFVVTPRNAYDKEGLMTPEITIRFIGGDFITN
jgi:hypothetical protein